MEPGFIKADSSNLTKVDMQMIMIYMPEKSCKSPETRHVKTLRNARESYGDEAVGRVQLKREAASSLCCVRARVTPEHRIHNKGYLVELMINEKDEQIISCICHDCVASQGGCKHAVALLFWLHRRYEEPSVTSVECYWTASRLSKVSSEAAVPLRNLLNANVSDLPPRNDDFLNAYFEEAKKCNSQSVLMQLKTLSPVKQISLHCLAVQYKKQLNNCETDLDDFKKFCMARISNSLTKKVEGITKAQFKSSAWYEVRYGRITASKAYEVTRCKTKDGTLIQSIFGSAKFEPTEAMKRGILLEDKIIEIVKEKKEINIKKCGIFINSLFPFFGASPDGIIATHCIEIKCPSKDKTIANYLTIDNKITIKPYTQLQIQMFLCNKQKGLFCVAAPDFEKTNNVKVIEIELDEDYCLDIIQKCTLFYEKFIFNKLLY